MCGSRSFSSLARAKERILPRRSSRCETEKSLASEMWSCRKQMKGRWSTSILPESATGISCAPITASFARATSVKRCCDCCQSGDWRSRARRSPDRHIAFPQLIVADRTASFRSANLRYIRGLRARVLNSFFSQSERERLGKPHFLLRRSRQTLLGLGVVVVERQDSGLRQRRAQ